jgi:hypothetical protein
MQAKSCLILFITPFVIGIIGFVIITFYYTNQGFQSSNWKPVEATVENVELKTIKTKNGSKDRVTISYKYFIEEIEYQGNTICIGYDMNTIEDQNEVYNKLSNADRITVFVNPHNYAQSVIIKGLSNNILVLIFFTLFISLPIVLAIVKKTDNTTLDMNTIVVLILMISNILCIWKVFSRDININPVNENIVVLKNKPKIIDN